MTSSIPHLGLGTSGGSAIPGGGTGQVFGNLFTSGTLVSQTGPTLSLTRATASYTTDFEGLVKPILSGEARFWKLRRVENLYGVSISTWTLSNATRTASVTDPNGGTDAFTITATGANGTGDANGGGSSPAGAKTGSLWIRRRTGTGTVSLRDSEGNYADVTAGLTTSWKRFSVLQASGTLNNHSSGVKIATSGDAVDVAYPQVEMVTGQAIQTASEYVSKGLLSAPYHGAGVDGVKYFSTANGNTVVSNVVTEATGASLTLTAAGLSVFGAATNVVLFNRDLTNAAWTASNVTVAKTATGADGVANAASTLTATAGNGTVLQAITLGSSSRSQETYVKRRTGTGVVNMTTDNGSTWTAITVTASWAKVRIPAQTLANPTVGFQIVTNGDAVDIDFVMNTSVVDAPAIATTTVAVTCNADSITASGAGVINQTEGTLYVKALTGPVLTGEFAAIDNNTSNERIDLLCQSPGRVFIQAGGVTQADITSGVVTASAVNKLAVRYRVNDFAISTNGAAVGTDASGTLPTTTQIELSARGAAQSNSVIQEIRLYSVGMTDAQLVALTA